MFEVKKNIPMPSERASNATYPFGKMEVGDMFEVENSIRARVASASNLYGKRNNKKFSLRKIAGSDKFGLWRLA